MKFSTGQVVKYVTSSKETVDGFIEDLYGGDKALIAWGEKGLALCHYSDLKFPNTFHLADAPDAPDAPQPFTPGTKARSEKPKKTGADAPSPVT